MRISRPPQLFGLFASTTDLPGIGARLAEILKKRIGTTVIDILRHLPVSIINRQISLDLDACENGQIVTVDAEIKSADILQPGPAALSDGLARLHDIITAWANQQSD